MGIGNRFALRQNGGNVEAAGGSSDSSFSRVVLLHPENESGIGLPVLVASNAYQK
jgi:hypothetical protein